MKRHNTKRAALHLLIFLAVFAIATAVVMLLWNAIIPGITGWGTLGFWHAAGLIVLCRVMLGGIGKGFHHLHRRHHERDNLHELRSRVAQMSFDEKRDYIRTHFNEARRGPCPSGYSSGKDEQ